MKSKLSGIRQAFSIERLGLRRRFAFDEHHDAIIRGFVVVAIFGVLAKLVGAGKEFALAWRFGTSIQIDAYLFIFNLYGIPVSIWVGALGGVLIPLLVRLGSAEPEQALLLQSEMKGVAALGGLVVGLLSAAATMIFIKSGLAGLTPDVAAKAFQLSWMLWPIIPMLFLVQVGSSQLMASRLHVNTAYEGLPALALIVSIWAIRGFSGLALVIGTLAGVAAQLIATHLSVRGSRGPIGFRFGFTSTAWKGLSAGFWLLALAYALQGVSALFDQFLLARLGPGAISTYGYASRLLALIISLGGIAISRTILPILTTMGMGDLAKFRRTTQIWVVVMFGAGALFFAVFGVFSHQIVQLAFEHGAFSRQDTENVSNLVWFLAQTVPFYFAMTVLVQAQLASNGHRTIIWLSGMALIIKIGLGLPLVWAYGVTGLAIVNILVTGFQFFYLAYTFNFLGLVKRQPVGER